MIDLESLRPKDMPDYMTPAWLGCMCWAIKEPEILAAFRAATGNRWEPPRTGLDHMIDEATGAGEAFVVAFITWASANVWGTLE